MKYSEILELYDDFSPAYNLENEGKNEGESHWKRFIINEKFYKILSATLNSFTLEKSAERQSIWIHGAFGTGKSHATAVIKHLLFDERDKIDDFIEDKIDSAPIKAKLKNFRKNQKVFPVVIKGTSGIVDNNTFALAIERVVEKKLEKANIKLSTKSDFEKMIYQLTANPANIDWETNIKSFVDLNKYVTTTNDLIRELEKRDIKILEELEKMCSQKGISFSQINIRNWLVEVKNELKRRSIADYLMIYWDEFTGMLESPNSGVLLTELQHIAELSEKEGVYLFIVCHRHPDQTKNLKEDIEKILGRFKNLSYEMEPKTTYHIVSNAIKKTNKSEWERHRNAGMQMTQTLVNKITKGENMDIRRSIENLFPIHPYTAYLATFISRNIGSAERSIFSFLYSEDKGFKSFINNNPDGNGQVFLTADYLWDHFYDVFDQNENEGFYPSLERFRSYKEAVETEGKQHLALFKGILLLNFLHRSAEITEESLITPNTENIKNLFLGEIDKGKLNNILHFLDDKQIINKNPDNLYLVTGGIRRSKEIEDTKAKFKNEYREVVKMLSNSNKERLVETLKNSANREMEVIILDAYLTKHSLITQMERYDFKKDYTIHVFAFLGKNDKELMEIKKTIKEIIRDEKNNMKQLDNLIFLVFNVFLDERTFDRFLIYKASAVIADKYNENEDRNNYEGFAEKILEKWINKVESGYADWFLAEKAGTELVNSFSEKVNTEFSKKIFQFGMENIGKMQKNRNIWRKTYSRKASEIFLFAYDREEIEKDTTKGVEKDLRNIIKNNNGEYIVTSNLELKEDISDRHPVKKMSIEIDKAIEQGKEQGTFNLADVLDFLKKPPYGLYPNMVNMGTTGFLMRKYVHKLYEARTGKPLQKNGMSEKIVALFNYWENNKKYEELDVRASTREEIGLTKILERIFRFKDAESLTDIRWKIRDWVKGTKFPIWVFNLSENMNETVKIALDVIFDLTKSVEGELTYDKIKEYYESIRRVDTDLVMLMHDQHRDDQFAKKLFIKWLKEKEIFEQGELEEDKDIEDLLSYIANQLQEEVASWEEDKVIVYAQRWQKARQENIKENKENSGNGNIMGRGEQNAKKPEPVSIQEIKKMTKSINECSGRKAKKMLIALIEEGPDLMIKSDIMRFIKKHLEKNTND